MSYPELTSIEAYNDLDGYRVIDVREEHEFHGPLGRIECAELAPLSTVAEKASTLDGDRPLLLVCRSGKRSGMACETLRAAGVDDVTNLAGGMIAWNRAGLAVSRTEPASLTALVDQVVSWTAQVGPLTTDAALDIVRERFKHQSVTYEAPTHGAVEELINFVGEALLPVNPPDLDLSLDAFRRSLAVL